MMRRPQGSTLTDTLVPYTRLFRSRGVVVDLGDVHFDPVLVGPLLHDSRLIRILPWHPAGVDGPGNIEAFLVLGLRGKRRKGCKDHGAGTECPLERIGLHGESPFHRVRRISDSAGFPSRKPG